MVDHARMLSIVLVPLFWFRRFEFGCLGAPEAADESLKGGSVTFVVGMYGAPNE